jgi:hypothetical protein
LLLLQLHLHFWDLIFNFRNSVVYSKLFIFHGCSSIASSLRMLLVVFTCSFLLLLTQLLFYLSSSSPPLLFQFLSFIWELSSKAFLMNLIVSSYLTGKGENGRWRSGGSPFRLARAKS